MPRRQTRRSGGRGRSGSSARGKSTTTPTSAGSGNQDPVPRRDRFIKGRLRYAQRSSGNGDFRLTPGVEKRCFKCTGRLAARSLQPSVLIWQSPVPMTIHFAHDETTHDLRAEDESKAHRRCRLGSGSRRSHICLESRDSGDNHATRRSSPAQEQIWP